MEKGLMFRMRCNLGGRDETYLNMIDYDTQQLIGVVRLDHDNSKSATILGLFVSEDFRRKGVGTRLVSACVRIAQRSGCLTVGLLIESPNSELIQFYSGLGFGFGYQYEGGGELWLRNL